MVTRYNQATFFTNHAVRSAAEFAAIMHARAVLDEPATTTNYADRIRLARVLLNLEEGDRKSAIEQFSLAISLIPGIFTKSLSGSVVDPAKLVDADFDNTVRDEWTRVALMIATPAPSEDVV